MKKVLLAVDDEKTILKLLELYFGSRYQVVSKANGKEALGWLQSGNIPDIIVADINMPEINGIEFIRHVRTSGLFKELPLITLSGNDSTADKIKCLRAGADDYLVKPFNPEELDARIDNIFRRLRL